MKKSIFTVFIVALPVLGIAADSIPKTFDSAAQDREAPVWVSADLARTPDNQIDLKLFTPQEGEALRGKLAELKGKGEGDCKVYEKTANPFAGEKKAAGFEGLVKSAKGIYSASITDLAQGFFLGSPASVLKLEVTKAWKTPSGEQPKELFAVYPFARFAIGDGVFCSGEPGSLHEPKAGQKVILFVTSDPLDRQRTLVWADPESLISEGSDGKLSLPQSLRNDPELFPVRGLGGLEELLRWTLSQQPGPLLRKP